MNKLLLTLVSTMVLSACSAPYTTSTTPMSHITTQSQEQIRKNKIDSMVAANGSPWIFIGSSVNNDKYYVNVDSINEYADDRAILQRGSPQAWWKTVASDNNYSTTQSVFYCRSGSFKTITRINYSASDKYINSIPGRLLDIGSTNIIPDTAFSKVHKLVCDLSW